MRLVMCLLVILLALATAQIGFDLRSDNRTVKASTLQAESGPKIMNARLKGKKLFVTGENFTPGAAIFVNGEKQKTKNDSDNPTTMLIAKKAGKKIPDDSVVSLQVQNGAGSSSDAFGFFSGRAVTIDDGGKTIEMKVGERILLILKKEDLDWEATVQDTTILKRVTDAEIIPGAQGVFEAQRAGRTTLFAQGDPRCSKSTPPCLTPSSFFEFNIAVQ
jgi:hypothetical protein